MLSWDDLRFAHALSEHGSLAAAARALRVDPTTVGRRITALEEALGVPVFVRASTGWEPTPPGRRVLEAAARAADAIRMAERVAEEAEAPRGTVRVTTIESVASNLLVPMLPRFSKQWPDVTVAITCTNRRLEIGREADIGIRVGSPHQSELLARRLAFVRERLYASPAWLDGRDAADVRDLDGVPLLSVGRPSELVAELGAYRPVMRSDSVITVAEGVRTGLGVALLPDIVARGMGIVPLTSLPAREELPLWLVTHPDLARLPRVRVLFDAIAAWSGL